MTTAAIAIALAIMRMTIAPAAKIAEAWSAARACLPMQSCNDTERPALAEYLCGKELLALKRRCDVQRTPCRCERIGGSPERQDGLGATEPLACEDAPRPKLRLHLRRERDLLCSVSACANQLSCVGDAGASAARSSSGNEAPALHALMTQQLLFQMLQRDARISVSDAPCDASSPVETSQSK